MAIVTEPERRPMPKELRELLIVSVCAALLSAAIIYLGGGPRNTPPKRDVSLQRVLDTGQLILGFDVGFPPMSFKDDKGEITGFDIDMVQEVCNRLGVALVKQPIDWDDKENELYDGTIDCITSLSEAHEEARRMILSEPYLKEELLFVIRGDSKIKWLSDLKGKTIGVQAGSTTQRAINATDFRNNVMVVLADNDLLVLQQLQQGKLDAGLVDSLVACYFIRSSKERYFILADSLGGEELRIGFRKGEQKLRDRVQEIISGMKADGTLGIISKKWFGMDITIVR